MSDFLTPITRAFTDVLSPLRLSFSNKEELETFLAHYGWDAQVNTGEMNAINAAFALQPLLAQVVDKLDLLINGVGSASLDAAEQLLTEVKNTITKLGSLSIPAGPTGSAIPFPFNQSTFWDELAEQIVEDLIVIYFEKRQPLLFGLLHFSGIIWFEKITWPSGTQGRIPYIRPHLDWDRLSGLFSKPGDVLNDLYKWNKPGEAFRHEAFLRVLERVFLAFGLPVYFGPPRASLSNNYLSSSHILPHRLNELEVCFIEGSSPTNRAYWKIGLVFLPVPDPIKSTEFPKGILILPLLQGELSGTNYFSKSVGLTISGAVDVADSITALVYPDKASVAADASKVEFDFSFTLQGKPEKPWILIGTKNNNRLELDGFTGQLGIRGTLRDPEIYFGLGTGQDSKLRIIAETKDGDGFLKSMLGENGFMAEAGIGLRWSSKRGLSVDSNLAIPINRAIGPIFFETVYVKAVGGPKGLDINIGIGIKGELGPLVVVVDNIGLKTSLVPKKKTPGIAPTNQTVGIFGNLDLEFGFKPPTALALSLTTPAVTASGGLKIDADAGEYIGTLYVNIVPIKLAINAIAIIQTKLPEGGFSLLIILTAEFPPLPLGFGFTLNGLGGLFGYKRGMEVDVLRNGLKNKTLDSILFPKNVKDNVGKVVSDLKSVFPATAEERFLIGPMAKIAWGGSRVTAELGVIIELPDPVRIAILGVIRVILPDEKAEMLKLQINFLGTIDFAQKRISLDANLEESRLLKVMTLTGQFALRIGWGSDPLFIFSAGGFHPDFKQAPVELQKMDRLGIVLIDKPNLKLRAESYFALTTNTLQFGARAFCSALWGPYSATVTGGFDTLIQFKPFQLEARVFLTGHAALPLNVKLVVEASATLKGPNGWRIWGSVTVFAVVPWGPFPFDVRFDGQPLPELAPEPVDVLSLLKQEVNVDGNWSADTPGSGISPKVTLRQLPQGGGIVLHPNTKLSFNQRLVPLGRNIQKFGDKAPIDTGPFEIKKIEIPEIPAANGKPAIPAVQWTSNQDLSDQFAPGLFFNIPKEQQLSRPSFQSFKSGVSFVLGQSEAIKGNETTKPLGEYERIYIKKKPSSKVTSAVPSSWKNFEDGQLTMLAGGGAAARSGLSDENNRSSYQAPGKVNLKEPAYIVASKKDLTNVNGKQTYRNQAEAYEIQQKLGRQADTIILSTYE